MKLRSIKFKSVKSTNDIAIMLIKKDNIKTQVQGMHPNLIDKQRKKRRTNWFTIDEMREGIKDVNNYAFGDEKNKRDLLQCSPAITCGDKIKCAKECLHQCLSCDHLACKH